MRIFRNFLTLGITANEAVVTGHRTPLGYQQITNPAAATFLTIPTIQAPSNPGGQISQVVPVYAVIQCSAFPVPWRDDGAAPTASVGMNLAVATQLDYASDIRRI